MFRMIFLILIVCSSACRPKKHESAATDDSFRQESIATPLTGPSTCRGPYTARTDLQPSIERLNPTAETDNTLQRLNTVWSSIPYGIQELFVKRRGKIQVVDTSQQQCPSAPEGIPSMCWREEELQPRIIISKDLLKDDTLAELSLSLVHSVGDLYERLLSRTEINEQGVIEDVFISDLDEFLVSLTVSYNQTVQDNISLSFSSDVFSTFFGFYFCNEDTRAYVQVGFPQAFAFFQQFEEFVSTEKESLSLAAGRLFAVPADIPSSSPVKTRYETAVGSYVKTSAVPVPHTSYSMGGKLTVDPTAYKSRAVLKGWYYEGNPRLVGPDELTIREIPAGLRPKDPIFEGKEPINILIPGTFQGHFVTKGKWADPDGQGARAISGTYGGVTLSFQWSGRNSKAAREEAAQELAVQIKQLWDKGSYVNLVTYSHGGNVAARALQILKEQEWPGKVNEVVTIARPVRSDYQVPTELVGGKYVQAYAESGDRIVPIGRSDFAFGKEGHFDTKRLVRDPLAADYIAFRRASHKTMQAKLSDIVEARARALRTQ